MSKTYKIIHNDISTQNYSRVKFHLQAKYFHTQKLEYGTWKNR